MTRRLKIWHFSYKRSILPIYSKYRESFARLNKKKKLFFFRKKNIIFSLKSRKILRYFSLTKFNFIKSQKLIYFYKKFQKFLQKVSKKHEGYAKIKKLLNNNNKIKNSQIKIFLLKNLRRNYKYKISLYQKHTKLIKFFVKYICLFFDNELDYLSVFLEEPQQNIENQVLAVTTLIKNLDKQKIALLSLRSHKNTRLERFFLMDRLAIAVTKPEEFYDAAFLSSEDLFTKNRPRVYYKLKKIQKLLNRNYLKTNYTFTGTLLSRHKALWAFKNQYSKQQYFKLKKVINLQNIKNVNFYLRNHQIFLEKIKFMNKTLQRELIETFFFQLALKEFLNKKRAYYTKRRVLGRRGAPPVFKYLYRGRNPRLTYFKGGRNIHKKLFYKIKRMKKRYIKLNRRFTKKKLRLSREGRKQRIRVFRNFPKRVKFNYLKRRFYSHLYRIIPQYKKYMWNVRQQRKIIVFTFSVKVERAMNKLFRRKRIKKYTHRLLQIGKLRFYFGNIRHRMIFNILKKCTKKLTYKVSLIKFISLLETRLVSVCLDYNYFVQFFLLKN